MREISCTGRQGDKLFLGNIEILEKHISLLLLLVRLYKYAHLYSCINTQTHAYGCMKIENQIFDQMYLRLIWLTINRHTHSMIFPRTMLVIHCLCQWTLKISSVNAFFNLWTVNDEFTNEYWLAEHS